VYPHPSTIPVIVPCVRDALKQGVSVGYTPD